MDCIHDGYSGFVAPGATLALRPEPYGDLVVGDALLYKIGEEFVLLLIGERLPDFPESPCIFANNILTLHLIYIGISLHGSFITKTERKD